MRKRTDVKTWVVISVFSVALGAAGTAAGQIIYVDTDGPADFNNIQAAINDAVDHDVVLVADGIYTGDGNKDLDFHGKSIIVRSENGPNDCIIDCQGQGRGFYLHSKEGSSVAIEGFTIINGCADSVGGGIRCTGYGSPTIKNCVIKNCTSTDPYGTGYGIACGYNTIIESCTVQGNEGGIAALYGATIRNCVITENYDAPGIVCYGGSPTIEHCSVNNNQGGGITLLKNNAIVESCIITGNVVREEHSYFALGGGINCFTGSSPTISNTIISGNFTEFGGGGICCNMESNAKIINCTITGNRANLCGGGIWAFSDCYPIISNSILWANTSEAGNQIAMGFPDYPESEYGGISVNYCDVEGGATDIFAGSNQTLNWGNGNMDAAPCFVEPGYWDANGTPYDANDDFWVDGDYHLLPDSPCIDTGDPNYIAEPNETDLDGRPRVIGGRIDMGAYESPIFAEARILPHTINLASKGKWITSYIWLPEEYDVADIDPNTVFLENLVLSESLSVNEQKQVAIARFSREDVQPILDVGDVELTITGQLTDGTVFEATDEIRIMDKGSKK